ncbi:DNA cytosine methyltransferase [Pseudoalteromonas sp. DL2-H2.2]|uniref:DNA cytosine methyltransferase n=1 Tax=Pseudoalteromonas sp. DL2-H2.2 TaxID=2908889 RepID=UPI001F359D0E|nr:DNA cytosine methyltransferase [Pseudoalteromonas sp. DL2-H2.2]MCF2909958.1 DNA cytosine methyltransferase [Pseudoalteromonas sp. DL2-H2.2]
MMKAIDLFSGAGGFSTGAEAAGIQVVQSANHWDLACEFYALNHPGNEPFCQDLQQADWSLFPSHDIGLASPCCQGHSIARGTDRPHHDIQRNTAWAVVGCAEYHREDAWLVENVTEFLNWTLYPSWLDAMKRLGYSMAEYTIDAADHSVPQHRKRAFLVFTRSKNPIELKLPERQHVPVHSVIDWDGFKWSKVYKPGRSPATIARIENGRRRFGHTFAAPYYSNGSGKTGRCINRPLGTVTTVDRWAVVRGDEMRMLQPSELKRVMGFPDDYILPNTRREAIKLLGNAVCPPVVTDLINAIKVAA